VLAAGDVQLSFDHRYRFESGSWDGGAVFMSHNGGAFTKVAGISFSSNGYNSAVLGNSASELAGQEAFVEASAGYDAGQFLTSVANLGSFAMGDSIQVRFTAAYDTNTSDASPDWAIDNVSLTNAVPEPASILLVVSAAAAMAVAARRKRSITRN
jgi:hypothetical protein